MDSEYSTITINGTNSRVDGHDEKNSDVVSVCRVMCTVEREVYSGCIEV